MYQKIYQKIISKHIPKTPYQIFFASTGKQGRIHSPNLIRHLPCSLIGPKVLPLHFNLLDCSISKHEHLFLQYTLRLRLELSIYFHPKYRPFNPKNCTNLPESYIDLAASLISQASLGSLLLLSFL